MTYISFLKQVLYRPKGDLRRISFDENGHELDMYVPDDHVWNMSRELILSRIYERPDWFSFSDIQGSVIDAGAHVGFFSVIASLYANKVISIEANPLNYHTLNLNVAMNSLPNISTKHGALWSSNEQISFLFGHDSGSGSISDKGYPVQGIPLADAIADAPDATVLKTDVEGAEFAALGAVTDFGNLRTIIGELHRPAGSSQVESLVQHLRAHGFEVDLVEEAYFYTPDMYRRARKNRHHLHGQRLTKLAIDPYYQVARTWSSRSNLPGLFARR